MGSGISATPSISVTNLGWGAGIRTPEMSESESDALPLGDTPIFRTRSIIAEFNVFVKGFLKKILSFFRERSAHQYNTLLGGLYLRVETLLLKILKKSCKR